MFRAYYVLYHNLNEYPTFQEEPDVLAKDTFDSENYEFISRFDYGQKRFYRNNMKRVRYIDIFAITENNVAIWSRVNVRKLQRNKAKVLKSEKLPDSDFIYVGIKVDENNRTCLDSEFLVDTDEVRLLDRLKVKHPGWKHFLFDKYAADSICGDISDSDEHDLDQYYDQGPEACYRQYLRLINCLRYRVESDGSRSYAFANYRRPDITKTHRDFMIPEFYSSMKTDYHHVFYWNYWDLISAHEFADNHEAINALNKINDSYPKCADSNVYVPTIYGP